MPPSIYKISKFFMIGAGLWRMPLFDNATHQRLYMVYSKTVQIIFVLNILSMIYRIYQLSATNSLEDLYIHLTLVFLVCEITYKVLLYVKNQIPYMFVTIVQREEAVFAAEDQEVKKLYLAAIRYYKLAAICQCFVVGSGIVWYISMNLYKKYILGLQENEHFMYQIWFPFDETKHDTIVTIYNIVIALYGFVFSSASSTPLQSLMVFSASQLRILQLNIDRKISNNASPDELADLIREHQFLIEFISKLSEGFKGILLLDYGLESISGATGLLQLVQLKKLTDIPYSLLFIINVLISLGFIAWSAHGILEESMNVANAAYESNWMDQNYDTKQIVLLMMIRAQKPLTIDVGPFMRLDAPATVSAVKGMYTYATFMKQVRSNRDQS